MSCPKLFFTQIDLNVDEFIANFENRCATSR